MHKEESLRVIEPVVEKARRGGLLFVGYKAWAAPVSLATAPTMRELLGANASRAVWDDPRQQGARLAVMVNEYESPAAALEALADELESNQLATVPRGPENVGEVSFAHPEGTPPAIYFVRGNLVVRVVSFGNRPIDVLPYATTLDEELQSVPSDGQDGGVEVTLRGEVLHAKPRWMNDDAYVKVIAPGAELSKSDGGIAVRGDGEVRVFVVEKGRQTYSGVARRE